MDGEKAMEVSMKRETMPRTDQGEQEKRKKAAGCRALRSHAMDIFLLSCTVAALRDPT
jgi:hypothetical protein